MENATEIGISRSHALEFATRIDSAIKKSEESGRPFIIILLQLANMQGFRNQRPTHVVEAMLRELHYEVRRAVHPTQFVGIFKDGLGMVFDNIEVGQADILSRKLVVITQNVMKNGKFNDLSSRWTDILYQFLWPNKPGILFPCVGWSMYPRDGAAGRDLVTRAFHHINELRR